jgi:hypothetical protein
MKGLDMAISLREICLKNCEMKLRLREIDNLFPISGGAANVKVAHIISKKKPTLMTTKSLSIAS